jgi:NADH:ubiquinone oxidoreductase subunit F (NADH-binding)
LATVLAATDTQASPSATAVINANVGRATFTGFTTAAAGTQTFVITNSLVTTSSCVLVTVCNEGANDAQMTVTRITRGAGSLSVATKNNGAAALNGNVAVNFWVLTA